MESHREFDIVVWGATGFVGRLAAQGLVERFGGGGLHWALAGRNAEKLKHVRAGLGSLAANIPIITGDSQDVGFLETLVARTKVVCSTVGPYAKYGSELVRACVRNGTHYCDITGEVHWIRKMIDAHQVRAEQTGARIVNACGFDSIPSDLGVFFLQRAAMQEYGVPCRHVRMRVNALKGGFSGGTGASLAYGMTVGLRDKTVLRHMTDPYSLNPDGQRQGPEPRDRVMSLKVTYDETLMSWTKPFFMSPVNCKIVRRTNALLGYPYGKCFRYEEASLTGTGPVGWLRATATSWLFAGFLVAMAVPPSRWLVTRLILPQSGEGPSQEVRESGLWEIRLIGTAADGEPLCARVHGAGDPATLSTSRMLIESAICLVECSDSITVGGGFWTPASAMGELLLARLASNARLSFHITQLE